MEILTSSLCQSSCPVRTAGKRLTGADEAVMQLNINISLHIFRIIVAMFDGTDAYTILQGPTIAVVSCLRVCNNRIIQYYVRENGNTLAFQL